ncbi:hypothetical protein QA612_04745 [Evansella sp. AB-P1]|uniref:coiled-coil domain-containing protein n=1 Tax=Evansella sp. AB-P1 TaxID=3037653 RepID=UPI00241CF164|nr:hypothetical protein [Evansella sp. AB-P1]MDG5786790.1 hypothetical protein [Evansella sp. AB-P1]
MFRKIKFPIFTLTFVSFLLIISGCNNDNDDGENNNNNEVDSLQAQIEELNEEISQLRSDLAEKEDEIADLESQLDEQNGDSGDNGTNNNGQTNGDSDPTQDEVLRNRADQVVIALENMNFTSLGEYVHPEQGVLFSPYGHVDFDEDLSFSAEEVGNFANDNEEYDWGTQDGSGHPIEMTPTEYYEEYIYIRDFSRESSEIVVNDIEEYGNIIVNVEEAFPEANFVSYYVTPTEGELDWANLILAFEEYDGEWYLVGLVVDRWTI